jgi:hypothetical protein
MVRASVSRHTERQNTMELDATRRENLLLVDLGKEEVILETEQMQGFLLLQKTQCHVSVEGRFWTSLHPA